MRKGENGHDVVLQELTRPARLMLEARAAWEFGAMLMAQPLLSRMPKGDGHPVLVLPLMFGNDLSTQPLRAFLTGKGYVAVPWELGINLGPREGVFDNCMERLHALYKEHRRKVSLIGWSLGGLYARALAKAAPGQVRCVITMGTPITGVPRPADLWKMCEVATGMPMGLPKNQGHIEDPPPVPLTSIYSRTDGIVAWQCSFQRAAPQAENVEVESSHLGLGVNPLALYVIADRLVQPEGLWKPFERTGMRTLLYRNPARPDWL